MLASLLFGSCATIAFEAPANKNLKMATQIDEPTVKIKKKAWHIFWGLVPITSNSTADMMEPCREMVKAKIYFGIDDILINAVSHVLAGSFVTTRTIEIQCK